MQHPRVHKVFLCSLILHMGTMCGCKGGDSHKCQDELRTLGSSQGWAFQDKTQSTLLSILANGQAG